MCGNHEKLSGNPVDTHAAGLKTKIKVLAVNSKFQGYCVEPINQFNMKKSPK